MKFLNTLSNFLKVSALGVGRDNRMCVNFEIRILFTKVILPIGVIFLPLQILTNTSIYFILLSIFCSDISFIFKTL